LRSSVSDNMRSAQQAQHCMRRVFSRIWQGLRRPTRKGYSDRARLTSWLLPNVVVPVESLVKLAGTPDYAGALWARGQSPATLAAAEASAPYAPGERSFTDRTGRRFTGQVVASDSVRRGNLCPQRGDILCFRQWQHWNISAWRKDCGWWLGLRRVLDS
jgi:hypothetical protein